MEKPSEKKRDRIILYDHLIREKISEAHDLFALWGETLWKDSRIISLLKSLEEKIDASGTTMEALGIPTACRDCSEEDGDTCCGAGIENKYTSRILLINLLLGNLLPEKRLRSNSCFFLSEKGCCLKARLVLCVNYLCLKLQKMLPLEDLTGLQQITGEEMDESFFLEEAVKKFIKEKTDGR